MVDPGHAGAADPIRAVICDDEPAAREAVRTLLPDDAGIRIVGEAGSGTEAVEVIRACSPDLLFLDVQMPDLDGFEVLEELGEAAPPAVIFVTAYDRHALDAFEVHALDYLLKPFGRPRLVRSVERARRHLEAGRALEVGRAMGGTGREGSALDPPAELERDRSRWSSEPSGEASRLAVRKGSRIVLVPVDEIGWMRADGDYVRIHTGDEEHLVSARMGDMEERLGPRGFLRIHRSILVRTDRIREVVPDGEGGGAVILDDGVRLRVARSRWDELGGALGI